MIIGAVIAITNVILTYNELIPFFTSIKQLNAYTKTYQSFSNHFMYMFRFISLLPKAAPLALDIIIGTVAGMIGLSGGVYGALISLTLGFTASLIVKIHRRFVDPKIKIQRGTWKVAHNL